MMFVWRGEVYPTSTVDGFTYFCAVTSVVYTVSTIIVSLFRKKNGIHVVTGSSFFHVGPMLFAFFQSCSTST